MNIDELLDEFLGLIDFEKSEIIHPKKLVFICGGKASGNAASPTSMRELLLRHAALTAAPGEFGNATVLLAEDAVNALSKSHFKNLLDLEEYIAAIVDAVLLIVESPGSMCELGAFVKTEEIREKLIVIMPGQYINVASFITSGAIRFLEEKHPSAQVLGYHWAVGNGGVVKAEDYVLQEMNINIPLSMQAVHPSYKKEQFEPHKTGHIIYLTLAFCLLLRAPRLYDLKQCFVKSKIQIDEGTLKRCLDTLTICKLVKPISLGKLTYYVAQISRISLEIAWKRTSPDRDRNTLRWIARLAEAIKKEESVKIDIFREHSHG